MSDHVMVADVTGPGRGVGFVDAADVDFLLSFQDGEWLVHESVTDNPMAKDEKLQEALRKFAGLIGVTTGTIELCWETREGQTEVITI